MGNPAALWLLLLLPVLLFVRPRVARTRMVVAALYLWNSSTAEMALRPRFVRWDRLLALQLAILSAIVVALARPAIAWGEREVAMLVDVSASMGATVDGSTRLDAAVSAASALLPQLPRTRVHLVAVSSRLTDLGVFDADDPALLARLQSLGPSGEASNLAEAVDAVQARGIHRVYVFSDVRGPTLDGVTWSVSGAPADNVAVSAMHVGPASLAGPETELLTTVTNFGDAPVAADLVLVSGERTLNRQPLRIPAHATVVAGYSLAGVRGVVTARVLHRDALPMDNERSTVAADARPVRVAVMRDQHPALHRVFTSLQQSGLMAVVEPGSAAADVIVCTDCNEASADSSILQVASTARAGAAEAPLALTGVDHPVLRSVLADGIPVIPSPGSAALADATVLARADASPVLLVREDRGRRAVELRAGLDGSALTTDAAFPVLIASAVGWLAATDEASVVAVGEPLRLRLPADTDASSLVLTGPDGQPVDFTVSGRTLSSTGAAALGVYRLRDRDAELVVAVNPTIDGESDLRAPGPTAEGVPGGAAPPLPDAPYELTAPLLMLAAGLLVVEWRMRHAARRHVTVS